MEEKIIDFLRNPKIFSDLKPEELERIANTMVIKSYNENDQIFQEGELGNEFYVILSGSVWVRKKDSAGNEHQLTVINTGEGFGEMALVDELPRSAGVKALEKTRVAVLSRDAFMKMKSENIAVYCHILENIVREFSTRLRSMDLKYVKVMNFLF